MADWSVNTYFIDLFVNQKISIFCPAEILKFYTLMISWPYMKGWSTNAPVYHRENADGV